LQVTSPQINASTPRSKYGQLTMWKTTVFAIWKLHQQTLVQQTLVSDDDDGSDKLFKSSNDLENSQQQTDNKTVLSNPENISSSALGGVGGTHSAQNAGRSEDEKEMRRNAHSSSSTNLSKKKERELDVVHLLNAIGAAKSAATGNVAKGSDSSYSAAAGSEKCTNVALEEEQSAELSEPVCIRLSLFVYFFFDKKVLLSMLANDLACSLGIVYLSNTFRTDKRFFRP
jgi:hypothetical protein